MVNLNAPLKSISRITPRYQKIFEKMRLKTVRDFLFYFPFRYDDFSKIVPINENYLERVVTVEGKVAKVKNARIFRKRMTITEVILEDNNGTPLKAVWFNQPFILDTLREGVSVRLSGKLILDGRKFLMKSPAWEKSSRDATNTGRLVPIYPETSGITSKWIRWQMKMLLPQAENMADIIPRDILSKFHLGDVYSSLCQIHFPDTKEKLIRAQKRFAFQEMFLVQLKALQIKKAWEGKNSITVNFNEKLIKSFVDKLPFKLTDAQRKATYEILKDLEKPRPMNRLLNGDVGSGKTIVAAAAALEILDSGYQAAIMAPTEVLARQHFLTFSELFKNYKINIALLTNSYKLICHPERNEGEHKRDVMKSKDLLTHITNADSSCLAGALRLSEASRRATTLPASPAGGRFAQNDRKKLLENIKEGVVNLIIGTHALIQRDVKFKNLALVVIDEQHRFGVAQRAALQQETMLAEDGSIKTIPHLLTMTATPIPRTLAIAFFGSLDLSILDEMPKNRKPIITKIVMPKGRDEIYHFIRGIIGSGRQAFVILPLIEESKDESMSEVKAATAEHKRLSEKIFPEFKLGLLHGRLSAKDKEKVMQNFKNKKLQILVSTSVVEVGVDIPNASIMVIENAERFGLSQLHQFRGRVGRAEHQSYCFFFSETASERLKVLEETNDGFKIAEKDLELRGPGQFFGTLQSGLPDIAMENLTNIKLIKFAREEAAQILSADPELKKHPALRDALKKFSEKIHLE